MFGQIIDLLLKQDDERRRISFLLVKLLFCATITANIYFRIFGCYDIISISDFKSLADFFIHGTAFVCFALFYLVWTVSYDLTSFLLTYLTLWLAAKLYNFLFLLINNSGKISAEILKDTALQKMTRFYIQFFNIVDIIEIEDNVAKPGRSFYKFYDYLLDVEDEKKEVSSREFTDTIALIIQFIIVYNILGLHFLSASIWLWIVAVTIAFLLSFFSLVAATLAMLVDIKLSRLLKLMDKLEPEYKKVRQTKTYNDCQCKWSK
jgi:hypothetical protein